jgi:hypothetical protein
MVYCMVLMYMVDVHGWHMVWHMMYMVDGLFMIHFIDISFSSWLMHEIVCMIGIHLMYGMAQV